MNDVQDIEALGNVLITHHRDFLLELLVQALHLVMEAEVSTVTGAGVESAPTAA